MPPQVWLISLLWWDSCSANKLLYALLLPNICMEVSFLATYSSPSLLMTFYFFQHLCLPLGSCLLSIQRTSAGFIFYCSPIHLEYIKCIYLLLSSCLCQYHNVQGNFHKNIWIPTQVNSKRDTLTKLGQIQPLINRHTKQCIQNCLGHLESLDSNSA